MRVLVFVFSHYFAIGLLALLAYVFGRRLTVNVRYHSALEQLCFSITLGLGVLIYLVFALGLCGLLTPTFLISSLCLGLLICHRVWSGWLSQARQARSDLKSLNKGKALLTLAAICIFVLPLAILPLYPPTSWDAIEYHLAASKSYIQNHQLMLTPYLRYPVFPQNNQMLFTLALLLYDDILAQLIEFLMLSVLVVAIISFGQRFFSRRAGLWAGAILLQSPLVIGVGSVALIDMGLMFFVMMVIYALWNYLDLRQHHWLVLAGVFCGLAVGTKYPALFFLVVLTVIVLYTGWKTRTLLRSLWPVLLAVVIFAPWLARNFYYMKNPVFPFFFELMGRTFGYGLWKPADFQGFFEDYSQFGVGKDLRALVLLPWNLVANWRSFGGFVSPLCFFAPHLLFILGVARKRIWGLLVIGSGFTLFWFFTVQVSRYLLPALPLLSLAAAAGFDSLVLQFRSSRRWARWTGHKFATILVALLLFSPGLAWSLFRLRERGSVPISAEQRDAYLIRALPSYPAYKLLNDLRGREYSLYAVYDANMAYFADGLFTGDYFGLGRYSRVLDKTSDSRLLYEELRILKADYFLIRNDIAKITLPHDAFFQSRFKLIYEQAGVLMFELTPSSQVNTVRVLSRYTSLRKPAAEILTMDHFEWLLR